MTEYKIYRNVIVYYANGKKYGYFELPSVIYEEGRRNKSIIYMEEATPFQIFWTNFKESFKK